MIQAKIIADSINQQTRLVTWELTYPRFIHSEFMTHRVFSRNAASSRAIPISKVIAKVRQNAATFVQWGANQAGMQSTRALNLVEENRAKHVWAKAARSACELAEDMQGTGAHKQVVNRLLEPFTHITVLATATDHANFFRLRAHPDAQPEFQVLAYTMLKAFMDGTPTPLRPGQWHAPFLSPEELATINGDDSLQGFQHPAFYRAAARCARVSYTNHDKEFTEEDDFNLSQQLIKGGHWSPFEHVARCEADSRYHHGGNFRGFRQLRKFYNNENVTALDNAATYNARPDWVKDLIG